MKNRDKYVQGDESRRILQPCRTGTEGEEMRLIDADKLAYRYWDEIGCKCVLDQEIEDAPTVDAVPVIHAHYIKKNFDDYECSNCHIHCHVESVCTIYNNYCPNCGARMDGKE